MALTERQQEIKQLQDKGLTPTDIGKRLGITTNAVYQQLRRMKTGTKAKPKAKAKAKATRTPAAAPSGGSIHVVTWTSPLQAIRERRAAIEVEIKAAARERDEATKLAASANTAHDKLLQKHESELANLTAAERALHGSKAAPKRARKRPSRAKAKPAAKSAASANGGAPAEAPVAAA